MSDHVFGLTALGLFVVWFPMILKQRRTLLPLFERQLTVREVQQGQIQLCKARFICGFPFLEGGGPWYRTLCYAFAVAAIHLQPASRVERSQGPLAPDFESKADFMRHFSPEDVQRAVRFLAISGALAASGTLSYFLEVP